MTSIGIETLERYWEVAVDDVPLVIVGAGRWGRLWSEVAARARRSEGKIALVARSNFHETLQWQAAGYGAGPQLLVSNTLEAALDELTKRNPMDGAIAIIASRPSDHLSTAYQTIGSGLPTLIEKPISADPSETTLFLKECARKRLTVGLGVEFALLPVAHFLAAQVAERGGCIDRMTLTWDDPASEMRHGGAKREHQEVSVLADLLPHAISIARIFTEGDEWSIAAAEIGADGKSGSLDMCCGEAHMIFRCDKAAERRVRTLNLFDGAARFASLDFAGDPVLTLCGNSVAPPSRISNLQSTLRLELGAFLCDVRRGAQPSPITADLGLYARLQSELPTALLSAKR